MSVSIFKYKISSSVILCASLFAILIGVNAYVLLNPQGLPKIQGVIIPDAQKISEFTLVDHNNQPFTQNDLQGSWVLLSYGYTDCPDVCPITLNIMANVERRLRESGQFDDLQMLFYTIDPLRDTVEHLSEYITFFSEDFIGLTYGLQHQTNHIPFEQSLGIVSAITPLAADEQEDDLKGYSVSHGVVLYLINPDGKLQAILKPEITKYGSHFFESDTIYQDYISIRKHFG